MDDTELEDMFRGMKKRFEGEDGKVFGGTKTAAQFLQQAEIDVLGVDQEGGIYALDVAFHEGGLNYRGKTRETVLKKLLRTVMALRAYHPTETLFCICFASPLVNPAVQGPLEAIFADLQAEYPDIEWDLITNEAFAERMHERVRKEFWAYDPAEDLDNDALIREEYRGIRPAPGYPACPDHSEKATLFELLGATDAVGIALTESFAMTPAASVAGYYLAHPEARYFGVGRIGRDQVKDYARRRGIAVDEAERLLAPNLGYAPA